MRLVLYVSRVSYDRLREEAGRRAHASGLEVTAEGAARALLYGALGLGPDGEGLAGRPNGAPQGGGGPTRPSEPLHLTTCGTAYRGCDPACPLDRKRREEELDEARGGAG